MLPRCKEFSEEYEHNLFGGTGGLERRHDDVRRHRLSPSERGITGRDLREPFLHHRRDERAVAREHAAARDRTAARARRHVLRVEQPLVDAERSMKPHAVAEARLLHFRADPRHAVGIKRDVESVASEA